MRLYQVFACDNSWSQQTKLTAGDFFGYSVSVDGNTALVGAMSQDAGAADTGAAYVFAYENGSWGQQAKLTTSDGGRQMIGDHQHQLDGAGNRITATETLAQPGGSGSIVQTIEVWVSCQVAPVNVPPICGNSVPPVYGNDVSPGCLFSFPLSL